jgi:aspartyl-tRNA(Asn)/glutamyl-tRNA(Gln) amidotransferase subunit C
MAVTRDDVEHIAALAKLAFSDAEKERLTQEMNTILDYMAQLNTLDTTRVEPLAQVIEASNVLREDAVTPGLAREDALRNAPARTEEFFRVPKVLGETSRTTDRQ